jgi:general secretion pathway protein M
MSTLSQRLAPLSAPLQAAWAQRNPREQQLLSLLGLLVCAAVLWLVALAPALQTMREAPARQASLDSQTQALRALQAEALSLKKPTAITRNEATRWLESSVAQTLGSGARISVQADRATLSLQATPAAELTRWLSQAREQALALPVQAQLQQATPASGSAKTPPPADTDVGVRWNGTLVLSLP